MPVAKRRSWHERFVWHDAVLVDLTLQPGENHLVVSLHKQERKSWFNCVRFCSQPAPALWSMIENDFPRSGNRLLEYVDARWFDAASGWFSQGESPQFERQVIEELAQKLGPDGEAIRSRLDALVTAASDFVGRRLARPLRRSCRASRGARPGGRTARGGRGARRRLSAGVSGRSAARPDRRTEGTVHRRRPPGSGRGADGAVAGASLPTSNARRWWRRIRSWRASGCCSSNDSRTTRTITTTSSSPARASSEAGCSRCRCSDGTVAQVAPALSDGRCRPL